MRTAIFICAGLGLIFAGGACPTARGQPADALEIDWLAFAHLTAEHFDGDGGTRFDAERFRFRSQARYRRLTGVMQLDLAGNDLGDSRPGTLANAVADLYVHYDLSSDHRLRFGQFKTPLGLDFNVPATSLDITKRGMEAGLVLQRDMGIMVSARDLGGAFGYDVGIFDIAGRSQATRYLDAQEGEENAYAARGHYDSGRWHAELAYGASGEAGGPGTADYRVGDLALRYQGDGWRAKAEWIEGRHVRGDPDRDEEVYYVHAGYDLSEKLELVARHYRGTSRIGGAATRLSNTYLGFSWHPIATERLRGRLLVNYVLAGGDRAAYTGVRGQRDDAVLIQFQLYGER